jgi:hypothetical protein
MSKYLINLTANLVTLGNVFTTERSYLYKNPEQYYAGSSFAFTKTLYVPELRVFQETLEGLSITNFTQIPLRESLPPDIPFSGPFLQNYSADGTLNTSSFINLLLIDKPPLRTGFFDFYVNGYIFSGLITKLTQYKHYNWQQDGSKYSYIEQPVPLGYGIQISSNQLYTAELESDGSYSLFPTPLFLFLSSLTGNEEILSSASNLDPNTYTNNIPGLPEGTTLDSFPISNTIGSLPISLFYISEADALRYIASYPNLIESVGNSPTVGQQLYASATSNKEITFDPISYLNKYSDVRQLYGYDTYGATVHYITIGYYQGRTIDNASSENTLTGGLYDERNSAIDLTNNLIIWPEGETIVPLGAGLSYKYNTRTYFLNTSVELEGNLKYLGVH